MSAFRLTCAIIGLDSIAFQTGPRSPAFGDDVIRIVSPSSMSKAEGDGLLRSNVAPNRLQFLFPASDFAALPESQRFLVALNFRGDRSQTKAVERIFPDGEWWISTTDKTSVTLSRVFAENHGPNKHS